MSSVSTALKREAAIQGWNFWINSATGENPLVERRPDGATLQWKPGQAAKMESYLSEFIPVNPFARFTEGPPDPETGEPINVSIDFKPVLIPLVLKKFLPWIAVYSLALIYISRKIPI